MLSARIPSAARFRIYVSSSRFLVCKYQDFTSDSKASEHWATKRELWVHKSHGKKTISQRHCLFSSDRRQLCICAAFPLNHPLLRSFIWKYARGCFAVRHVNCTGILNISFTFLRRPWREHPKHLSQTPNSLTLRWSWSRKRETYATRKNWVRSKTSVYFVGNTQFNKEDIQI